MADPDASEASRIRGAKRLAATQGSSDRAAAVAPLLEVIRTHRESKRHDASLRDAEFRRDREELIVLTDSVASDLAAQAKAKQEAPGREVADCLYALMEAAQSVDEAPAARRRAAEQLAAYAETHGDIPDTRRILETAVKRLDQVLEREMTDGGWFGTAHADRSHFLSQRTLIRQALSRQPPLTGAPR